MKAFPATRMGQSSPETEGMDLRDYFAAHCPFEITDLDCYFKVDYEDFSPKQLIKTLAEYRYLYADAMMEARK